MASVMKKYLYIIVALTIFASCSTSDNIEEPVTDMRENRLEAWLEDENSRTEMGSFTYDGYKNLWCEQDSIAVYIDGYNHAHIYTLEEGAGNTTATFRGYGRGNDYVAIYPSAIAAGYDEEGAHVVLPSQQRYARNTFSSGSYPMIATSHSSGLQFRNLCSVLRISITGRGTVTSITFKANDESAFVSGEATVSSDFTDEPKLIPGSNTTNEVTLDCGGIMLNKTTAEDFYMVIPAQEYKGGFTLTITTLSGYMIKTTENDVVMERSQLRGIQPFQLELTEGLMPSETLSGEGTEDNPFIIASVEDLMLMMSAINSVDATIETTGTENQTVARNAYYKLTNNLDLSEYAKFIGLWTPIGNYSANDNFVFDGVFDGGNHTISNLQINTDATYQGLFGYVKAGTVKNLKVSGKVKSGSYSGIICGRNDALIENCSVTGSIEGMGDKTSNTGGIVGYGNNISNCINDASVVGVSYTGGIAGTSTGTVKNCESHMGLSGSASYVGGIVGYQESGYIYNCANYGKECYLAATSHLGGICGYMRSGAQIANCYNEGSPFTFYGYVGGIVGYCEAANLGDSNDYNTTVRNCVNSAQVMTYELPEYAGGICGYSSGTIKNCYWLYDIYSTTAKGIGTDNGLSERIAMLTDDQMSGKTPCTVPLYTDSEHLSFTDIVDALNAWAADNKVDDGFFYGWKKGDKSPVFTKNEPVRPTTGVKSSLQVLKLTHSLGEFVVPTASGTGVEGNIDWGDSSSTPYKTAQKHTYSSVREYNVVLTLEKATNITMDNIVGLTTINLSDF